MHTSVLDITNAYAAGKTLRLLADVPRSLEMFVLSLQSAFTFGLIRSSASQLRKSTTKDCSGLRFPDQLSWLAENGYSREDTRQIRYVVEIFHHLEPVFMVIMALAARVMKTSDADAGSGSWALGSVEDDVLCSGPIQHLDEKTYKKCLDPIFEKFGFPAHLFFRSLAVWPDFLENIWACVERSIDADEYAVASNGLHAKVNSLAARIPLSRSSCVFGDECTNDAIENALSTSVDVMLIASSLRRAFLRTEVASRNKRAISMS